MRDKEKAALLKVIEGLDLNSADGRAGIGQLLREIEAVDPAGSETETTAPAENLPDEAAD